MRRALIASLALSACRPPAAPTPSTVAFDLPVELESDRFFLATKTSSGEPIRLYLDSAGGMFLTADAVKRLALPITTEPGDDGKPEPIAAFPVLADTHIPRPQMAGMPIMDRSQGDEGDGMLGAPWFAGHVFTFDYANHRLVLRADGDVPAVAAPHRIPVGFLRDDAGAVIAPYGRIQIAVDGVAIDMLLDTGATVVLTDSARAALGGAATNRATSFIIASVFARWHEAHPEWRVVEAADQTVKGEPMIEVPRVSIAGYEVGPVWFTRRPDAAFHEFMAQYMDKPSDGAFGGSGLKYLRITVDWTQGVAAFER